MAQRIAASAKRMPRFLTIGLPPGVLIPTHTFDMLSEWKSAAGGSHLVHTNFGAPADA